MIVIYFMETDIIINIGIYKTLGIISTLVVGAWYASHRLTKVETEVNGFDKRLTGLEGRMDGDFDQKLKEAAYRNGIGMYVVRRIGVIYFRDIFLNLYNFRPEDLDKPDDPQSKS